MTKHRIPERVAKAAKKRLLVSETAKKRLIVSMASVQPTAELERKAVELAELADRASKARFLDKYRRLQAA